MEKSPSSVYHYLDACRAYLCLKAGSNKKNLSPNSKKKKNRKTETKLQRSHRHQHVEKTWWWDRADQQVSCVIFSEIIHSLDDYFSIHVKTSPTANNTTERNSVLHILIILIIIIIPEIFMCATVSVRPSWQVSAANAETWKWPLLVHSNPSQEPSL